MNATKTLCTILLSLSAMACSKIEGISPTKYFSFGRMVKVSKSYECHLAATQLATYYYQNSYLTADMYNKLSLDWGNTTFEISGQIGMTEEAVIDLNKETIQKYSDMGERLKKNAMAFQSYSHTLNNKMNECAALIGSDPEIRSIFQYFARKPPA